MGSLAASSSSSRTAQDEQKQKPAFEEVYSAFFHQVSRWVRAMGGLECDQEDLTQEVFIIVRRKLSAFDGRNLKGWLYRITQRTVRDYCRESWFKRLFKRESEGSTEHRRLVAPENPGEAFEQKEARRWLAKILNQMTEKRRTAFVLFEIEGYSGEEIAELEGVALNTIWTRLYHARRDFSALIEAARTEGLP